MTSTPWRPSRTRRTWPNSTAPPPAGGASRCSSAGQLWTAFAAVAGTFFIIWIVEPLTYFPILGPAAMYQAFMIGNISNKLLPAALIAQTNINAKAGTKRGELAAVFSTVLLAWFVRSKTAASGAQLAYLE